MMQEIQQGMSRAAVAVLLCVAAAAQAQDTSVAQTFPSRPVRFIVPFVPGGNSDKLTRLVTNELSKAWGQQAVVDNRAGAGGIIGMELGRKEAPDGYTVMTASAGILAINPFLYAKLPYDPVRDFAPVSMGAFFAHILTVHPSLPVKSVKDLVALAKSRAGQLAYGSAGVGTPNHLAGELFKMTTGTNLVHVPYKGAADSLVALLGGHVSLMFAPVAMALPHGESGKLRLLATTTLKRPDYVPNLPTMSEAGISGYEVIAWNGFVVPAGTPQPVVAKLNADIVRILRAPDIKQQLLAGGDEPWATTPDEFARIIRSEMGKWSQVVRESGARAN